MSAANPPHLLIVDDDREICALLSKFLGDHGYRVSVAADGEAMMEVLANARVDLVVLDIMLPGRAASSSARSCAPAGGCPSSC
jgi:two-component system OmpR family response regulator